MLAGLPLAVPMKAQPAPPLITVRAGDLQLLVRPAGTRYHFQVGDREPFAADRDAGLLLNGLPVTLKYNGRCRAGACTLRGVNSDGEVVNLTVTIRPNHAALTATPEKPGEAIRFVTGGAAPAYALPELAELSSLRAPKPDKRYGTDVSGANEDAFVEGGPGGSRLPSNLLYYPKQGFAEVLIDPGTKIVETSATRIVQGLAAAAGGPPQVQATVHYFFGDPHAIFQAYLDARKAAGFQADVPQYQAIARDADGLLSLSLEDRLLPTLYAYARKASADGYPWTMTPLPVAYPSDPGVVGGQNAAAGGEWKIGESLLAASLPADTAASHDVYLPAGTWMEWETGQIRQGGQTLHGFAPSAGRATLFVGGPGVLLEKKPGGTDAPVTVAVYPVGQQGQRVSLLLPGSEIPFSVTVDGAPAGVWTAAATVTDRAGRPVPTELEGRALRFVPKPGEAYRVR